MHNKLNFISGEVLPFDKPYKWTSFELVKYVKDKIKEISPELSKIKVGHAGTLDPLATGLLIICTGKATKKIEYFQNLKKEYIADIRFGATTPSFDLEKDFDKFYEYKHITKCKLEEVLQQFIGVIEQIPPIYSAKNVYGKRAYEYAREGYDINLKPSKVEIYNIEIIKFELPDVKLKISCGKGTYIRSLVRDIGYSLSSGAYLINLRRTAIGNYIVDKAFTIETFDIFLQKFFETKNN